MIYPNGEILLSNLWMKNFSSWLECLTSARQTAEYALIFPSCVNNTWLGPIAENQLIFLSFSSSLEYFLLFFNETIVLSDSWSFPVSWDIFFYSSMKQMSYPILEFFQFPGIFSSILQWNNGPIRFFGRFSSVYQWNIKRNFSLDVYLITLTIHRWDSFASSTWFGFFSSWVLIWSTVFKL